MDLQSAQKNWDQFAASDPLWAILTDPGKKDGRWDRTEFFQSGEREVAELLRYLEQQLPGLRRGSALDFGCGVGRLTQPLAGHFDEVYGMDISPRMLELAQEFNRHGERCLFLLNRRSDLADVAAQKFDLVYSSITLQHIAPVYVRRYLAEFVRVMKPGGALVFQLPSHWKEARRWRRLKHGLYTRFLWPVLRRGTPLMEMHSIARDEVVSVLERAGARVLDIAPSACAGPEWTAYRYLAVKESG